MVQSSIITLSASKFMRTNVLLALVVAPFSWAQRLPFRTISIEQGLAQSVVYAVVQDRDGFMWFGTQTGLSRFDGLQFVTLTKEQGLKSDLIRAIVPCREGGIWIGTEDGVGKVEGLKVTWLNALEGSSVRCLAETKQGDLWVGTYGDGAYRFFDQSVEAWTSDKGLPSNRIRSILAQRDGSVLVGTYGAGLARIRSGEIDSWGLEQGLGDLFVRALFEDESGLVWVGTNQGVYHFDGVNISSRQEYRELKDTTITSMIRDRQSRMWFATRERGVYVEVSKGLRFYDTNVGLANNSVYAIAEDHEGNLWFGTYGGGVSRLSHEDFVIIDRDHGLQNPSVYGFVEDLNGHMWFATNGGGLSCYDGNSVRTLTREDGLVDNTVLTIEMDANGDLWLGTLNGISIYSDRKFETLSLDSHFDSPIVYDISQSPDGSMWFGTYDGAIVLNAGKYREIPGLESLRINVIEFDAMGRAWLGSRDGLFMLDGDVLTRFDQEHELPDAFINDLYMDPNGGVWVATPDGCVRFRDHQVIDRVQGLPSSFCTVVTGDPKAGIWVGTNRGVARVDEGVARLYTSSDGLPSNEVNRGAGFVDRAGLVWMGTIRGVACFVNSQPKPALPAPRVHIASVENLQRKLELDQSPTLAFNENYLVFKFLGISLSRSESLRYRTKLEGLHDIWRELDAREIQYTSIPPGSYRFLVQASNGDGIWSEPKSYAFTVVPPIWRQPWFIGLVVSLAVLMAAAWVTRLKRYNAVLEQKVMQRTAEVQKMYDEIQHLAVTDDLTGLRNRRYLDLMMPMELKRLNRKRVEVGFHEREPENHEEWAGVLLIDLDYFKQVNDTFGHTAGDMVLVEVGNLLRETLRETDIIARLGGEEFIVYLGDVGYDKISMIAEKLLAVIRTHDFKVEMHKPIRVTCSIGYTMLPHHEDSRHLDWQSLVQVADAALYRAKKTGRDKAVGLNPMRDVPFQEAVTMLHRHPLEALDQGLFQYTV